MAAPRSSSTSTNPESQRAETHYPPERSEQQQRQQSVQRDSTPFEHIRESVAAIRTIVMQLPNSSALAGMLADLARFEVALSDLEQLTQQGQIRSDDGSPERHSGESTELRSEQRQEGQIPTSGATGTAEMQEELHRVRDADKDWKG